MAFKLFFEEKVPQVLEDLGRADAKRLKQVFLKILTLRRSPTPSDCKRLANFQYKKMKGFRIRQGEYRIVYAVDDKAKKIYIAYVLKRGQEYRELES